MGRYQTDPAYRERIRTRSRERYRQLNSVELRDAGANVGRIAEFASRRKVGGESIECLDIPEVASAIGYHPDRVRHWICEGKFPKPSMEVSGSKLRVYSVPQAKRLVSIIGNHQNRSQHLRKADSGTIAKLHAVGE